MILNKFLLLLLISFFMKSNKFDLIIKFFDALD